MAVVRKAASLYTLTEAYYFLEFTQISQKKKIIIITMKNLIALFTAGSLGKARSELSW